MNAATEFAPLTVKVGGVAGSQAASLALLAARADPSCVLVHGGGPELSAWLGRLGIEPRIADGLRVTDPATLDVAVAVLAGLVNTRLVAALEAYGRRAVGLTGADAGLLTLERSTPALGEVGRPVSADPAVLNLLTGAGLLPVVSSIGSDGHGALLNVNADEAAGTIAAARGGRLLLCTDVRGVHRGDAMLTDLTVDQAAAMVADGSASAGMVPKLRAAMAAAVAGCEVWILDGRSPQAIEAALIGEATGTRVHAAVGTGANA